MTSLGDITSSDSSSRNCTREKGLLKPQSSSVKCRRRPRFLIGISGLGLGIGWLQGQFQATSHRVSGLCTVLELLLLLGIFQERDGADSGKRRDSKPSDVSSLPNQKWLVRRRDHMGKLRHVGTLDHAPSLQELSRYGPGNYSILTTKPGLKSWKSVVIPDKKETASKQPSPPPPPSERTTRFPDQPKSKIEVSKPEKKTIFKRRAEEVVTEPPPKQSRNVEPLKTDAALSSEGLDRPSRRMPPPDKSVKGMKPSVSEPKETCARCLQPSLSPVRCDFCQEILCTDYRRGCFEGHDCPNSKACFMCGRRVPNHLVVIPGYCHQYLCSEKCLNECRMDNRKNAECKDCVVKSMDGNDGRKTGQEEKVPQEKDDREDAIPEERESTDEGEEEFVEMCDGIPKEQACMTCQVEDCVGRFCDGLCYGCSFDACGDRCENDGFCKTCEEFDDCRIRCREAPKDCDKRHCEGFECDYRYPSGTHCDEDCQNCKDTGCYFWRHPEEEDRDDAE